MAWKLLLEEEKDSFNRIEDWEKEYTFDYQAVKVVVNKLTPENYEFALQKKHMKKNSICKINDDANKTKTC